MKVVAFVPVRLTSTRLPKKHLKMIGDRSLLSWVIKRLKDASEIDQIVLCAPGEAESSELKSVSASEDVELFTYIGDNNDVVGRLTAAAMAYQAEYCVLASGDCPLLSSSSINKLVYSLKMNPGKNVAGIGLKDGKLSIHEGFFVAHIKIWKKANNVSNTPELREHLFPVIWSSHPAITGLSRLVLEDDEIYYTVTHRISVDTPADLDFMNTAYHELKKNKLNFNLENVIQLITNNAKLISINSDVYQKKVSDKSFRIAFYVTGISSYGYGNVMRSIDIARTLTNTYGYGVAFFVLDGAAKELVERHGFVCAVLKELEISEDDLNGFDTVIFDINKNYEVNMHCITLLKNSNIPIIVIDNVRESSLLADLIIIPTAHYSGPSFDNLLSGSEYVVIRDEVKRCASKYLKMEKKKVTLIYSHDNEDQSNVDSICERIRKEDPTISFQWITNFDSSFLEYLGKSKYYITHLGISAYESLCLGVKTLIIPNTDESEDIQAFEEMANNINPEEMMLGSKKIASKINEITTTNRIKNRSYEEICR